MSKICVLQVARRELTSYYIVFCDFFLMKKKKKTTILMLLYGFSWWSFRLNTQVQCCFCLLVVCVCVCVCVCTWLTGFLCVVFLVLFFLGGWGLSFGLSTWLQCCNFFILVVLQTKRPVALPTPLSVKGCFRKL